MMDPLYWFQGLPGVPALAIILIFFLGSGFVLTWLGRRINRLSELRTTRLQQTTSGVLWVLWVALLVIPLFLLAGIGLVNDPNPVFHYLIVTLTAAAISIAIFVALELDLPYRGIAALPPTPIAIAIDQALSDVAPDTPVTRAK